MLAPLGFEAAAGLYGYVGGRALTSYGGVPLITYSAFHYWPANQGTPPDVVFLCWTPVVIAIYLIVTIDAWLWLPLAARIALPTLLAAAVSLFVVTLVDPVFWINSLIVPARAPGVYLPIHLSDLAPMLLSPLVYVALPAAVLRWRRLLPGLALVACVIGLACGAWQVDVETWQSFFGGV